MLGAYRLAATIHLVIEVKLVDKIEMPILRGDDAMLKRKEMAVQK